MDSPIVSAAEMRAAEEAAFERGIDVEALMNEAGAGVARAVRQFFPHPGECIVYAGKGHNGGDALVAAERLQREGWKVDVRLPFPESDCSELTRKKLAALRDARRDELPLVQNDTPVRRRDRFLRRPSLTKKICWSL